MSSAPDSLSTLAFLYLTFSHATDGTLSMDEMRTVATKMQGWAPDVGLETLGGIIKQAVADYQALPVDERLAAARQRATELKGQASAEALAKILTDLEAIAGADGTVSPGEQAFIDEMRAHFAG